MSRYNQYSNPYDQEQYNDPAYYTQLPSPHHPADNPSETYSDGPNPYNEDPRHSVYPSVAPSGGFQEYSSTEKIVEGGGYGRNTERAQPGRSGLRKSTRSFAEAGPPPRSTGILRMWRKDERGKQWFRGGGFKSCLRIFCCCTTISLIMAISIVLAILLYVRPPNVALQSVNLGSNPVNLTSSGLTVSFALSISVSNPNWFSVNFKEIQANARYPGNNANTFGGGTLFNANFGGYSQSEFQFPFTLNYTTALDPNRVILTDLINKCGAKSDLTVDYDLYLKLQVLGITVRPTISNSASFECPIDPGDLQGIFGKGS